MIRLNLAYFYVLGQRLAPLERADQNTTVSAILGDLYAAKVVLESLLNEEVISPATRTSRLPAQTLVGIFDQIINDTNYARTLGFSGAALSSALSDVDGAIKAELNVADAYFVTRKAAYDSEVLAERGHLVFPIDLGEKVPEAMQDATQAARCMAFELSTAAGFHSMRTVESVLRQYWNSVTNGAAPPPQRNIGDYLRELDSIQKGDPKVKSVLRQIKDLHRNPLAHPDIHLTLDEAIGLFGISVSAITAMLKEIPGPTNALAITLPSGPTP